ncbi:hypothetical protein HG530_005038 [Fusarium avenaceum]|nr:hypothetical protein HG530_005038 [Fusarium avenaceum]
MLVTEAVDVFAIMLGSEGVVTVGDTLLDTYPEVDIEVACAAEFPIADLEGDSHGVILVEGFVEAFSTVGGQDDVVSSDS